MLIKAVAFGFLTTMTMTPTGMAQAQEMLVAKTASCGCCGAWMARMQAAGFVTAADNLEIDVLYQLKAAVGVPEQMTACHTAMVDGYVIEGHVPAADITRLLEARPEAVGLAVPGMPTGAPGMEYGDIREAYVVYLISQDGATSDFATYPEG